MKNVVKLSYAQEKALREIQERGPVARRRGGWGYWRWLDPKQIFVPFGDSTIRALAKKGLLKLSIAGSDEIAGIPKP